LVPIAAGAFLCPLRSEQSSYRRNKCIWTSRLGDMHACGALALKFAKAGVEHKRDAALFEPFAHGVVFPSLNA